MTKKIRISIAIFGGLIVLISTLLIVPTVRDIRRLNASIVEERALLEARYTKRHTVRKAIEFVQTIRTEFNDLRVLAVEEGHEIDLVSSVEAIADRTGVVHEIRLTPVPDPAKHGYDRRLEIDISARGEPRNLGKFYEEIERLPAALLGETLSVSRSSETGSDGAVSQWHGAVSWPETL